MRITPTKLPDPPDQKLLLRWIDTYGVCLELTIPRLFQMRFDDFRSRNIVLELSICDAQDLSKPWIRFLYSYGAKLKPKEVRECRKLLKGLTAIYLTATMGFGGIAITSAPPSQWIVRTVPADEL